MVNKDPDNMHDWEMRLAQLRDETTRIEAMHQETKLALHSVLQSYASFFDQAADGIALLNSEGRFEDVNPALCALLGRSREELMSLGARDVLAHEDFQINPHIFEKVADGSQLINRCRLVTEDGACVDVEITAVRLPQGRFTALVRDMRSHTEAKRTKAALRERESHFRLLFEQSNDAVFIHSLDQGQILDANHQAELITGYTRDQLMGMKVFDLRPEAEQDRSRQALNKCGATGSVCMESVFLRSDGAVRNVDISASVIDHEKGIVQSIVRDITKRKQAEESLQQALAETRISQTELTALLSGTRAVLQSADFQTAARCIFDACKYLLGATSGYVALLNTSGEENEVLFLDSGERACTVDPDLPMPVRGLRATVYKSGHTAYDNEFMNSEWSRYMPSGHVALDNVLFAPLNIQGRTVGIMGVANKPGGFNDNDARLASAFGEIAAIALTNHLALEQIAESEARHRALFETSPIGIVRTSVDSRFLETNQAFQNMVGYSDHELQSMTFYDITPPEWHETDQNAVRKGREIGHNGYEKEYLTKDGRRIPVSVTAWVIRDDKGGVKHIQGFITDITERKRMEQALRDSEIQYRTLAENTLDLIVRFDRQRRCIYVNPAAIKRSGMSQEFVLGKTTRELGYDPNLSDFIDESIDFVFEKGEPLQLEFTVRSQGRATPFDSRMVPEIGADGTVQSVIATMRDIADIKSAELEKDSFQQQLLQAQKMEAIGQLAGGVAHDFNNMLTVIMAGAQLGLMRAARDSEDFREYSSILEASEKARDLTMKLLTFARKEKLSVHSVSINRLINDLLPLLEKSLPSRVRPVLDLRCPASALLDRNQIHQALLNVCNNAADAMPAGGTLRIETELIHFESGTCPQCGLELAGAFCRIRIRDTGIGVSPQILDKITEPFFTTKGIGKGTGLGLAITHGIITGHDGHLHISSKPGEGTCVEILLPADASPESAPAPIKLPEAPTRGAETILLVDDEMPVLITAGRTLTQLGYRTLAASSGAEAIALFRDKHRGIDAVLLDLVMPGMDGEQVYEELLKIDPGVRVILCSGYSAEGLAGRVIDKGVQAFVQKPFTIAALGKAVRSALDAPGKPRI